MFLELGPDRRYDITYRPVIMGSIDCTSGPFAEPGGRRSLDGVVTRAERLVGEGADLLDVVGVAIGPGAPVSTEEEIDRVVPVIEALVERFDVPVSVGTWNPVVLTTALGAGAVVGNDLSGFAHPDYLPICARHQASVVATHIRLSPRIADPNPECTEVLAEVRGFLTAAAARAEATGIPRQRIMVSDGLGLGKTAAQSLALLRTSDQLAALGYPAVLSASTERFLDELVGPGVEDHHDAMLAAHALGVGLGCRILRSHDVQGSRRVADAIAAILEVRAEAEAA